MLDLLRQVRAVLEMEVAAVGPFLPIRERPSAPTVQPSPETHVNTADAVSTDAAASVMTTNDRIRVERLLALIPPDSALLTIDNLSELSAYVARTPLVAIDRTRTNPVFGVGNPDADLMVIGEAPGADEDAKGEPFVGRAGRLLNDILKATGFSRETVYIANILKSRPPNNRDPQPEEIAAHVPILYRQISLIRPKMLLSVGRISATVLLGRKASLASMRGKLHDFHGIPLVVTYHPAALLRNPEWKRPTWEDMKFLQKHFNRL